MSAPAKKEAGVENSEKKEIGPDDFKKVKLLGQGDVGKVYLVHFRVRFPFLSCSLSLTE
jgi:hypothetical protein